MIAALKMRRDKTEDALTIHAAKTHGLKRTMVDACLSQVIQNKRKRSRRLQSIILLTLMMKMRIQSKQENQLRWLRRNFNIDSSSMLERKSITKRLWQVDKSHSNR